MRKFSRYTSATGLTNQNPTDNGELDSSNDQTSVEDPIMGPIERETHDRDQAKLESAIAELEKEIIVLEKYFEKKIQTLLI